MTINIIIMKRMKFLALAFLAIAAVTVTFAFKPAKATFADSYFVYDGSSGNQFDPSHYTETTEGATSGLTDLTGQVAVIRVTTGDETFLDGSNILRPKVDADDASSTIHSNLISAQNSTDNFDKVANRIWVQD